MIVSLQSMISRFCSKSSRFLFRFGVDIFTLQNWKHCANFKQFFYTIKEFTNHKTNTMGSTFNYTTIDCNQMLVQELQFTLIACNSTCKNKTPVKSSTCGITDWHYIEGKSIVTWPFDLLTPGRLAVYEGFYMKRKRDLIISWRYTSLVMNRGVIKRGFIVIQIYISYIES